MVLYDGGTALRCGCRGESEKTSRDKLRVPNWMNSDRSVGTAQIIDGVSWPMTHPIPARRGHFANEPGQLEAMRYSKHYQCRVDKL